MRKYIFTFLLVFASSASSFADQLTVQQAKSIAQKFANNQANKVSAAKSSNGNLCSNQPLVLTYTAPANRLYVFNQPNKQGYIIVSGDDNAAPVLGYSDYGAFDYKSMPENMKAWLNECENQIAFAAKNGSKYIAKSTTTDWKVIEPMIKSTWGQTDPYNRLCPKIKGETTLTGCGATALAQVMNYYRYPDAPTGMAFKNSIDLSKDTFDWNNILDKYTNPDYSLIETTEEQKNAIALLMRDAGYSLNMQYGTDLSGSTSHMLAFAIVTNMLYDPATHLETRACYDDETWNKMVYDNLATNGPMIYNGFGPTMQSGGHCFVCDGYAGNGYFHFNWGWDGNQNGYFLLSALTPNSSSGSLHVYNYDQDAVFNMKKPVEGSKNITKIVARNGDIAFKDNNIYNELSFLINKPCKLALGYKITNLSSGDISYISTNEIYLSLPERGTNSIKYPFISKIADGEYTVVPYFHTEQDEWMPVQFFYNKHSECHLSVKEGKQFVYFDIPFTFVDDYPELGINNSEVYNNINMKFIAKIATNGGKHLLDFHGEIVDEQNNQVIAKGEHINKLLGISDTNCQFEYTIPVGDINSNHTYSIIAYDGDKVLSKYTGKKASKAPLLEVIKPFTIEEIKNGEIGENDDELHITAQLRNINKVPMKCINFQFVCKDGTSTSFTESGSLNEQNKDYTIDGDVINIDTYYDAMLTAGDSLSMSFTPITLGDYAFQALDNKPFEVSAKIVEYDPSTAIKQTENKFQTASKVELFNIDGKKLGTYNRASITSHLPSGVYIVKLSYDKGKVKYIKIVK